jgi:hypothetical protein
VQDNTSRGSLFPPCVPSHADPSGLGHAAIIYSSVQGPHGVETPTHALIDLLPLPMGEKNHHDAKEWTELIPNMHITTK